MRRLCLLTRRFFSEQDGQDTLEYTLLLGFVALAAVAIFPVVTESIKVLLNVLDKSLSNTSNTPQ